MRRSSNQNIIINSLIAAVVLIFWNRGHFWQIFHIPIDEITIINGIVVRKRDIRLRVLRRANIRNLKRVILITRCWRSLLSLLLGSSLLLLLALLLILLLLLLPLLLLLLILLLLLLELLDLLLDRRDILLPMLRHETRFCRGDRERRVRSHCRVGGLKWIRLRLLRSSGGGSSSLRVGERSSRCSGCLCSDLRFLRKIDLKNSSIRLECFDVFRESLLNCFEE